MNVQRGKWMGKMRQGQSGFSLVELMVVVAIIGILAAIAVPNFQKFTAKSKQSEVKSNLSALYSSERAFQAEWQTYSASFQSVGYAPVGNLRYEHGFGAAFPGGMAAADYPTGYTVPATNSINTAAYCVTTGNPCTISQKPVAPGAVVAAATGGATTFIAEGRGDIDGDSVVDVWRINELKALTNLTPDID